MFDPYYVGLFLRVLAICLVLTGIHGYLGIHVLARQVIFVDLAMAQIAALGATYALLLGYDPAHNPGDALPAYLFSLGFTFLGAGVLALTRMRRERVPQEAVIGIVYATAAALVILMLAKSPTAGEQIKHVLVGNILLVEWPMIAKTAATYAIIALFHWRFRGIFLRISFDPAGAASDGVRLRLWDFLFYMTFGVVITSSVAIAGVLLVFSFLVVPAAVGLLYAETTGARVAIGWGVGTVVSILGILFSFWADVPAGPAVVASFAAVLAVAGLVSSLVHAPSPRRAAGRGLVGTAAVALAFYGTTFLGKSPESHEHVSEFDQIVQVLETGSESERIDALHHVEEAPDPHLLRHVLALIEGNPSDRVLEHGVKTLAAFGDTSVVPVLTRLAKSDFDPYLRIEIARAIFALRSPSGIPILLTILQEDTGALVRQEALGLLKEVTGRTFDYDPLGTERRNTAAAKRWQAFWEDHGPHLEWREQMRRFE